MRQVPVGPYYADFVCRACKLVVELDGSQHADSAYDDKRDAILLAPGYRVLRFWNADVLGSIDDVCETIVAAIEGRLAPFERFKQLTANDRRQPSPSSGAARHLPPARGGGKVMIRSEPRFAELAAMTNFSFLRGASHPEEMAARAAELGYAGIGIADRNTLAGVVRAHVYARENAAAMGGMRVVPGARLAFMDGAPDVLAHPIDRAAYGRLCRILTAGNLRAPKGECHLRIEDLLEHGEGLQVVALPPTRPLPPCGGGLGRGVARTHRESLGQGNNGERGATPHPGPPPQGGREGALLSLLREAFGARLWIGASLTYGEEMRGGLARRGALARAIDAPLLGCMRPSGARLPTSSPASARKRRWRRRGA